MKQGRPLHEAESFVYRSSLPWNSTPRLSEYNYSSYAFVGGGSSNWWGGKCSRISEHVFSSRECLPWALGGDDLRAWYELAEKRLNVSGDPANLEGEPVNSMPGAAYWRKALSPYLASSSIYNVALNFGREGANGQGVCKGRGACAICHNDAKARPDNIFRELNILYGSQVVEIEFEGSVARGVLVFNGKEIFRVTFDRLVVAANGLETPRVLARSDLPSGVRRDYIGMFYQDHAHFSMQCRIPKPIAFRSLGGLCHLKVQELSKFFETALGTVEVGALALTHPPHPDDLHLAVPLHKVFDPVNPIGREELAEYMGGFFEVYCEFEIPPQAGLRVDLNSDEPRVIDGRYAELIPEFDLMAKKMADILLRRGVEVLGSKHWYRNGYGGHHFCGTVNMSDSDQSVLDIDCKLIGSENVYCAGAAVIPRAGGVAPTLTVVALAERLGSYLSAV